MRIERKHSSATSMVLHQLQRIWASNDALIYGCINPTAGMEVDVVYCGDQRRYQVFFKRDATDGSWVTYKTSGGAIVMWEQDCYNRWTRETRHPHPRPRGLSQTTTSHGKCSHPDYAIPLNTVRNANRKWCSKRWQLQIIVHVSFSRRKRWEGKTPSWSILCKLLWRNQCFVSWYGVKRI